MRGPLVIIGPAIVGVAQPAPAQRGPDGPSAFQSATDLEAGRIDFALSGTAPPR